MSEEERKKQGAKKKEREFTESELRRLACVGITVVDAPVVDSPPCPKDSRKP